MTTRATCRPRAACSSCHCRCNRARSSDGRCSLSPPGDQETQPDSDMPQSCRTLRQFCATTVKRSAPNGATNVLANPAQQVFALGRCGCPNRLEVGRGPAKFHIRVEATAGWIGVEVEERLVP